MISWLVGPPQVGSSTDFAFVTGIIPTKLAIAINATTSFTFNKIQSKELFNQLIAKFACLYGNYSMTKGIDMPISTKESEPNWAWAEYYWEKLNEMMLCMP